MNGHKSVRIALACCAERYDRAALERHWQTVGRAADPVTGMVLQSRDLFPNFAMRRDVQSFLDQHPESASVG